jgi:hypothetical protein
VYDILGGELRKADDDEHEQEDIAEWANSMVGDSQPPLLRDRLASSLGLAEYAYLKVIGHAVDVELRFSRHACTKNEHDENGHSQAANKPNKQVVIEKNHAFANMLTTHVFVEMKHDSKMNQAVVKFAIGEPLLRAYLDYQNMNSSLIYDAHDHLFVTQSKCRLVHLQAPVAMFAFNSHMFDSRSSGIAQNVCFYHDRHTKYFFMTVS